MGARRSLGLAYARLGAGPQAEEQLVGCAQRGVADAEVFRALGEVYLERGDTASGVKALMRARDAKPEDVDARRALARALAAQGDLEGAIRELEAAHGSATDDGALEDELDRITERAYTKRVKELEARLLANEEDCQARLQLAVALARRGDLPEAIEHLDLVSRRRDFAAEALAKAKQIPRRRRLTAARTGPATPLASRDQRLSGAGHRGPGNTTSQPHPTTAPRASSSSKPSHAVTGPKTRWRVWRPS